MVKNLAANAGDVGSIPGLGRSPGEGNGNPLQYSCLGNHMDRGAWKAMVHGIARDSDISLGLNNMKLNVTAHRLFNALLVLAFISFEMKEAC